MILNDEKRALQRHLFGKIVDARSPRSVLCLPGETGWDAHFFSQYRSIERIVGLERERNWDLYKKIRSITKHLPKVEMVLSTTTSFLKNTSETFDLVYLDYCGKFGSEAKEDLSTIVDRQIVSEGGDVVVAFWSAQESNLEKEMHERYFDLLSARVPSREWWEYIDPFRRRAVAFNAFLTTLWAKFESPRWFVYRGTGGPMLVGHFIVSEYGESLPTEEIEQSADAWYARGRHAPRAWRGRSSEN